MRHQAAIGAVALCLLGGAAVLWATREHPPELAGVAAPRAAALPPPVTAPVPRTAFPGVILAGETVELVAPFEGRLARFHFELGQRVPKGASVATLDVRTLVQEQRSAEAALKAAQAEEQRTTVDVENAAAELASRKALQARGLISAEELRAGEAAHKSAVARQQAEAAHVLERQAQVEQLRQRLEDAELRAPFDAQVAVRLLDAGSWVRQGAPVARLISAGDLRVRFAVPEHETGPLAPGLEVRVAVEALGVSVPAVVEHVAPEVDLASGHVLAVARLKPQELAGARVSAGMVARVSFSAPVTAEAP